MLVPATHHGSDLPDKKNSDVLRPARREKKAAIPKERTKYTPIRIQSMDVSMSPLGQVGMERLEKDHGGVNTSVSS
jgi:hypothetical protein